MAIEYISHIRKNENGNIEAIQSNAEHCFGVAMLAKQFANEFDMGEWGYILGLLHDKGKEKKEFQDYIRDVNGIPNHKGWTPQGKAHSYVGAIMAEKLYPEYYPIMSQPIMGHHGGMQNYCDFKEAMNQDIPKDVCPFDFTPPLVNTQIIENIGDNCFEYSVLMRMLFSCLKDADILDTDKFQHPEKYKQSQKNKTIKELLPMLESYLNSISKQDTYVNRIRKRVQDLCIEKSKGERGFYSLTVPTGGGKTLSSMLWAMKHALRNGQNRIIIAIPFTSIIVQTAKKMKEIFGEENVLEHHCNFVIDEDDKETEERICSAMDNWDYPIIVTTNVQLFESMFSNKSSDCRKLHNIANSVIILDEVQALPTEFINPILSALKSYKRHFGTSVLFMTASQPILCGKRKSWSGRCFKGIKKDEWHEIIPETELLYDKLRRVEIKADNKESTYEEIADKLSQYPRVLCIVNSRKDAKEIYNKLPNGGKYHLSRLMYPKDVDNKINEIKKILKTDAPIIRVVSTQLVEAGVDIDFPIVFRQEAGLDSILQAAGRCNREGCLKLGHTFVFKLEHQDTKGTLSNAINAFNLFKLDEYEDWFSPEAMYGYFKWLYNNSNFDKENIEKECRIDKKKYCPDINFETIHQKFKLIEDNGISIFVLTKSNVNLLRQVKNDGYISHKNLNKLGKYMVNIRKSDFKKLLVQGLLEEIIPKSNLYQTVSEKQYNSEIGLVFENIFIQVSQVP